MRQTSRLPKIAPDLSQDSMPVSTADLAVDVCDNCPHVHVNVLGHAATPQALREFVSALRAWTDRLDRRERVQ